MKTKIKNCTIAFVLFFVFVSSVLLLQVGITAKADTKVTFSASVQPYVDNVGNETVNFTRREEQYVETVNGVPLYKAQTDLQNSCGATAGAILVGFYDKYYEDLIPNYTSYYTASGKYKSNDKVYIPALMNELYTLMRTNVDAPGVNESDCLNGLSSYIKSKNHTLNYSSVKQSSKISESAYLNSINSNKPVLIFNKSTDIVTGFVASSNSETISTATISDNHIYVGYGYYVVKYYNGNTNFRTDTYIKVACGLNIYTSAFIKIASTVSTVNNSWLINAYSISVN